MRRIWILWGALAGVAFSTNGCVSTTVVKANSTPPIMASGDIPEEQLLDIGIVIFDAGVPEEEESQEEENIFPGVRQAEARYIPYQLKKTLQSTGNWGAVRVIPRDTGSVDLLVKGRIVDSDGERLKVEISAVDSSGTIWVQQEFADMASKYSYRGDQDGLPSGEDPFQDLYNEIANALLLARRNLPPERLATIREVTQLRFARELAPDVFGGYLEDEDGAYRISRLPAREDPMVSRMRRIREREYMFFDTLDNHYADFQGDMSAPYDEWRRYSYEEVIALREMQRQARLRKLLGAAAVVGSFAVSNSNSGSNANVTNAASNAMLIGGITAVMSGFELQKESRIHAEALQELGASFQAEVEPMVMEIEGRTVELSGSVDDQFDEWRRILREIYMTETGIALEASEEQGPEGG